MLSEHSGQDEEQLERRPEKYEETSWERETYSRVVGSRQGTEPGSDSV